MVSCYYTTVVPGRDCSCPFPKLFFFQFLFFYQLLVPLFFFFNGVTSVLSPCIRMYRVLSTYNICYRYSRQVQGARSAVGNDGAEVHRRLDVRVDTHLRSVLHHLHKASGHPCATDLPCLGRVGSGRVGGRRWVDLCVCRGGGAGAAKTCLCTIPPYHTKKNEKEKWSRRRFQNETKMKRTLYILLAICNFLPWLTKMILMIKKVVCLCKFFFYLFLPFPSPSSSIPNPPLPH